MARVSPNYNRLAFWGVLLLSLPPLIWFAHSWRVPPDASWYLLHGLNIISGKGYVDIQGDPQIVRGPVFPAFLGFIMLLLGKNIDQLAWAVRLFALLNPLLLYLLIKRLLGTREALVAALFLAYFGYTSTLSQAFNIDAFLLTEYLLTAYLVLTAVDRRSSWLSLLSGFMLGLMILTKETSIVVLPTAVVAALLLGWTLKDVLLHYLGVLVICAPWWVWVWNVSQSVFLLGKVPVYFLYLVVAVSLIAVMVFYLAYRLGVFHKLAIYLQANRERCAWVLVIGWTLIASLAMLSQVNDLRVDQSTAKYLVNQVMRGTPLWYVLPLGGLFAIWKSIKGSRNWAYLLAMGILWVPVSLVALVMEISIRQWMIQQALGYAALAGLYIAAPEFFSRLKDWDWKIVLKGIPSRSQVIAFVSSHYLLNYALTCVLILFLIWGTGVQTRVLANGIASNTANDNPVATDINPAVLDMKNWIDQNIPKGETILATWQYSYQLAFQDDFKHKWKAFKMNCASGPESISASSCRLDIQVTPVWPPTQIPFWMHMDNACRPTMVTFSDLIKEMRKDRASYLLMTRQQDFTATNSWTPSLVASGAFELMYQTFVRRGSPSNQISLSMLRITGREPRNLPTQMSAESVINLAQCERRRVGEDKYVQSIRSILPYGIWLVSDPNDNTAYSAERERQAREIIESIYGYLPKMPSQNS